MNKTNKEHSLKINLELNKEELLKDLKEIRNEIKSITKEIDTDIKHLRLKRKDILVVKMDIFLKDIDKDKIEKRLKKKLHRKVIVLDASIREIETIER